MPTLRFEKKKTQLNKNICKTEIGKSEINQCSIYWLEKNFFFMILEYSVHIYLFYILPKELITSYLYNLALYQNRFS